MIKKNKKIILNTTIVLVFIIIAIISMNYSIYISSNLISNVITFLSILFGFYITSFSIFATSKYVSLLYKTDDIESGRKQSLMDTLIKKYKFGLVVALLSILYNGIILLLMGGDGFITSCKIYSSVFISIILFNFFYGFEMMHILIKIVRQTATLNDK